MKFNIAPSVTVLFYLSVHFYQSVRSFKCKLPETVIAWLAIYDIVYCLIEIFFYSAHHPGCRTFIFIVIINTLILCVYSATKR